MDDQTQTQTQTAPRKKSRRGFAAMSPEKQREIASLGGRAAHAKGTAHQFTSEEARWAGSRGGCAARRKRFAVVPAAPVVPSVDEKLEGDAP